MKKPTGTRYEFGATSFALPLPVLQARAEAFAKAGIVWRECTATADPYRVPVGLFTAPTDKSAGHLFVRVHRILGVTQFDRFVACRAGGRRTKLFCGVRGTVTTMKVSKDSDEPKTTAYRVLTAELQEFSRLTGGLLSFELHQELDSAAERAPRPDAPGRISIMTFAVPPGELTHHNITDAFGLSLDQESRLVRACRPVPGRGAVAGDGEHMLVQVLGNTWYLLVPLVGTYNDNTTRRIFAELLALSWDLWQKPVQQHRQRPLGRKKFCATAGALVKKSGEALDLAVQQLDGVIERLRQDMIRLQRDRQRFQHMRGAFERGLPAAIKTAGFSAQWGRLAKHPYIERLEWVQDGLHAITRPINYQYESTVYRLGRFVVRIGNEGVVSVWNLDVLHPEGIPHPHIKKNGGPCFGNADDAIGQAAAEYRYADAIEYMLRWLVEGYHPQLALAKVEEWPVEPVALEQEAAS